MSAPAKVPVGLLVKLALAAVVAGVVGVLLLRGVDVRGAVDQGFVWINSAGPWVFFAAMAILPAIGCPLLLFYLSVGKAFGDQLGMVPAVALSLAAMGVNVALTYWLAHRGLRPVIEWLLRHTSYKVPRVAPENEMAMTILVRVTPGPPFFLQGYILGLAGVRFRTYMLVTMIVQGVLGTGFIVLGKGIMTQGASGAVVFGVLLVVSTLAAVQIVRRRIAKRDAGNAATR